MIPQRITEYLDQHHMPYEHRLHRRAVSAQQLAASMHVPGGRVAKCVIVDADGKTWIAVLPATELLDTERLASVLGVPSVRLLREAEFESLFPGCEPGAEPPFGGLYGLPVVVDSDLAEAGSIVFRAGSHDEAIEMRFDDFANLEHTRVGRFGRTSDSTPRVWEDWPESLFSGE